MLAVLVLSGFFSVHPIADGQNVVLDTSHQYWCLPGKVCAENGGLCKRPYTDVIVENMADNAYGNTHFVVSVTRVANGDSPATPVRFIIQWTNPLDRPLLIRGPWLGAYGSCVH